MAANAFFETKPFDPEPPLTSAQGKTYRRLVGTGSRRGGPMPSDPLPPAPSCPIARRADISAFGPGDWSAGADRQRKGLAGSALAGGS